MSSTSAVSSTGLTRPPRTNADIRKERPKIGRSFLLGQQDQITVRDEILCAVQDTDVIDAILLRVLCGGGTVIPQVQQVDLGKPLGQEGRQRVGIGIPDQQKLPAICDIFVSDNTQWLVTA